MEAYQKPMPWNVIEKICGKPRGHFILSWSSKGPSVCFGCCFSLNGHVYLQLNTINRYLFGKASGEYEYNLHLIEVELFQRQIDYCDSCGDDPHSAITDGNFKLPRYGKKQPKE